MAELREADLVTFRAMRDALETDGIQLVDWIRCDTDQLRSVAIAEGPDGWR